MNKKITLILAALGATVAALTFAVVSEAGSPGHVGAWQPGANTGQMRAGHGYGAGGGAGAGGQMKTRRSRVKERIAARAPVPAPPAPYV